MYHPPFTQLHPMPLPPSPHLTPPHPLSLAPPHPPHTPSPYPTPPQRTHLTNLNTSLRGCLNSSWNTSAPLRRPFCSTSLATYSSSSRWSRSVTVSGADGHISDELHTPRTHVHKRIHTHTTAPITLHNHACYTNYITVLIAKLH